MFAPLAALALLTALAPAPVLAQTRSQGGGGAGGNAATVTEQARAREQMQAGRNMLIRDIERRILPQMNGDEYIGFEYDSTASAYRLKFIRQGRVIWVDVDARTARILRVSQ